MKKAAIVFAMLFMLCSLALGEDMRVVNCEEWVSLRVQPDVKSERIVEVPLGAVVENCKPVENDFIQAEYNGATGYILKRFLTSVRPASNGAAMQADTTGLVYPMPIEYSELVAHGDEILRFTGGEYAVVATREWTDGELLRIGCYRSGIERMWSWFAKTSDATELSQTDAFIGGTAQEPQVILYNALSGMVSVNIIDGSVNWLIPIDACSFGASISHTVGEDGTIYVAGYYGPDPIAVSSTGEVLWTSDANDANIYWPYEMYLKNDCLIVNYESESANGHYVVAYSRQTGERVWVDSAN